MQTSGTAEVQAPWMYYNEEERKQQYYYSHIQCAMTLKEVGEKYSISTADLIAWAEKAGMPTFSYTQGVTPHERHKFTLDPDPDRKSRDQMWMDVAVVVSSRSTCLTCQVGAVVTVDGRVIATGYNGAPTGKYHCTDVGVCKKEIFGAKHHDCSILGQLGAAYELSRSVHAEQSCITQAANSGVSLDGGVIYVTREPCVICLRMIISVGIYKVLYMTGSRAPAMKEIFPAEEMV